MVGQQQHAETLTQQHTVGSTFYKKLRFCADRRVAGVPGYRLQERNVRPQSASAKCLWCPRHLHVSTCRQLPQLPVAISHQVKVSQSQQSADPAQRPDPTHAQIPCAVHVYIPPLPALSASALCSLCALALLPCMCVREGERDAMRFNI